jgi:hypothetical protein
MTTAGEASSAIIPGDEGAHSQHDLYKRDPHERLGRRRQRAVVGKQLGDHDPSSSMAMVTTSAP